MVKGGAKWLKNPLKKDKNQLLKEVGREKNSLTPKQLCSGKALELLPFCRDIFAIQFEQKPNYGKLRHMLSVILLKKNQIPDLIFEWSNFRPLEQSIQIDENIEDPQGD